MLARNVAAATAVIVTADRTPSVKRWTGFDGPSVSPIPRGPALFDEVRAVLGQHVRFAEPWALDLAALWVLQAHLAGSLPSVFYVFFSATKGRAKTVTLDLLCSLTAGLNASDISVAALVHWLDEHANGTVCIDEYDVARDAERDSALGAICRNGYTKSKPYLRYDPTLRNIVECSTYGAKALGFRASVDDALEDRGFVLPTGSLSGREGAALVIRNLRQEVGDLPQRLGEWARSLQSSRPTLDEVILNETKRDSWLEKVEQVVGAENLGANRETQLTMIALAVCRAACIDLTNSLCAAFAVRRAVAAANESIDLEEARAVLWEIISRVGTLTKEAEIYVVRQKDFADALNARRKDRNLRPLTSAQLARLRNDVGIRPTWLTHPKNRATWNIPVKEWDAFLGQGVANPPNPPNPTVTDGGVSQVSQVRFGLPESGRSVSKDTYALREEEDNWAVSGEDQTRSKETGA